MELTLTNIFQFLATLAPLIVGMFLILTSVFNQNVKGLIYLSGILLAFVLNTIIMNVIRSPSKIGRAASCDLIKWPLGLNNFNSPSWNSVFIAFTFAYMYLPMNYSGIMNYPVLIMLAVLFGMDAVTQVRNSCTTGTGILLGSLVGFLFGGLWYGAMKASGNPQLLYFEEVSKGEACSKPSKQKFKCAVYKNGKLVKNL